jgi:hypothetical protein
MRPTGSRDGAGAAGYYLAHRLVGHRRTTGVPARFLEYDKRRFT